MFQVTNDILDSINSPLSSISNSAVDAQSQSSLKISGEAAFPKAFIFFFVALFISFLLVGFN